MKERTKLLIIAGVYAAAYFVPWSDRIRRMITMDLFEGTNRRKD